MELSSAAFADGDRMPDKYGYTNQNINPPLTVDGVPPGAASLVLIIDDPDAVEPAGKVWSHWVVWNIDPGIDEIPEDSTPAGGIAGMTDFNEPGYGGPNPPDREHTYRFRLFALDTTLDLTASAEKNDVEDAIEGHVIDEAQLTGTFAPEQT